MNISLVYNAGAGLGVPVDELRREIEAGGHSVVAMLELTGEAALTVKRRTDLVVVAGGDGTVRRVAIGLAGRSLPLTILPFGTANNIATSLGIQGPFPELIANWQTARRLPLDLGIATGPLPWGERHFIESVGAGLVAHGIATMDSEAPHDEVHPEDLINKAVGRFHEVLDGMSPRPCQLTLDGVPIQAELLLVEVLNIRAVGPGLQLAAGADPTDGCFDVVTAGERDRPELERYLHDRLAGRPAELRLPAVRARQAELVGWDHIHLDDDVLTDLGGGPVTVRMHRAAVEILAA